MSQFLMSYLVFVILFSLLPSLSFTKPVNSVRFVPVIFSPAKITDDDGPKSTGDLSAQMKNKVTIDVGDLLEFNDLSVDEGSDLTVENVKRVITDSGALSLSNITNSSAEVVLKRLLGLKDEIMQKLELDRSPLPANKVLTDRALKNIQKYVRQTPTTPSTRTRRDASPHAAERPLSKIALLGEKARLNGEMEHTFKFKLSLLTSEEIVSAKMLFDVKSVDEVVQKNSLPSHKNNRRIRRNAKQRTLSRKKRYHVSGDEHEAFQYEITITRVKILGNRQTEQTVDFVTSDEYCGKEGTMKLDVTELLKKYNTENGTQNIYLKISAVYVHSPTQKYEISRLSFGDFADDFAKLPTIEIAQYEKKSSKRPTRDLSSTPECAESNNSHCCVKKLTIDFSRFPSFNFILAPRVLEVNYCEGMCHRVSNKVFHYSYFRHKSVLNTDKKLDQCCTPSKMNYVDLLYLNSNNEVTLGKGLALAISGCYCNF